MPVSTPEMWNHILTLMAAIVVSDKRIREDEKRSFIKNTRLMADKIDRCLDVSDDDLTLWFSARRDDIAQKITHENMSDFVINTIIALEPFLHKQVLLNCLTSIAAADAEMHKKEVEIINIAAAYWGLNPIRTRS